MNRLPLGAAGPFPSCRLADAAICLVVSARHALWTRSLLMIRGLGASGADTDGHGAPHAYSIAAAAADSAGEAMHDRSSDVSGQLGAGRANAAAEVLCCSGEQQRRSFPTVAC